MTIDLEEADFPAGPQYRWGEQGPFEGGCFYIDGASGARTMDPRARRPSWAVVRFSEDGGQPRPQAVWGGMASGIRPSSGTAEIEAATEAFLQVSGSIAIYTD